MKGLTRFTSIGFPALIGVGVAWVAIRAISNEKRLAERKIELDLQLGVMSLKGF